MTLFAEVVDASQDVSRRSGRLDKVARLAELLEHIRAHDDVWWATHADVADLLHPGPSTSGGDPT